MAHRPGQKPSSGHGTWADPAGWQYVGQWSAGEPEGRGKITWPRGDVYEGQLQAGKLHGEGTQTFRDGHRYEGQHKNGTKDGRGVFKFVDGRSYEGQYKADQKHGQGTFQWADGRRYEGRWKDDEGHGHGTKTDANGNRYYGGWCNGERGGVGTYTFANGTAWAGNWEGGEPLPAVGAEEDGHWSFHLEEHLLPSAKDRHCPGPAKSDRVQASATVATVRGREAQRRAAEWLPAAELLGKEIEIDGIGACVVVPPFKKGGRFGMGASVHTVRILPRSGTHQSRGERVILLRRNNNGGHTFVIVQPGAAPRRSGSCPPLRAGPPKPTHHGASARASPAQGRSRQAAVLAAAAPSPPVLTKIVTVRREMLLSFPSAVPGASLGFSFAVGSTDPDLQGQEQERGPRGGAGVKVSAVGGGGQASRAGLQVGDLLAEVGGVPVCVEIADGSDAVVPLLVNATRPLQLLVARLVDEEVVDEDSAGVAGERLEQARRRADHLQQHAATARSRQDDLQQHAATARSRQESAVLAARNAQAEAEKAAAVAEEMALLSKAAEEAEAGACAEAESACAAAEAAIADVEEARKAAKAEAVALAAERRREAAAAAAAAAAAVAATGAVTAMAAAAMAERAANEALRRSNEPQVFTVAQLEAATGGFLRPLAEGSFGAVYRGVLQPSGRVIAIKVLKAEAAAVAVAKKHEEFVGVGSFRKELEVLSKYRHQNIVELLGFCLSGGGGSGGSGGGPAVAATRQCLVFEFCAGGALNSRITSGMALTPQQRFEIASDVGRGLEYLHVKADPPIIHQDIKSDNILLAEFEGRLLAKVADFGTARYTPALLQGKTHHSTQLVIGTKPYMPLEYLQSGHVSEKTDAFAFGVVLCELLTGEGPANHDKGEMLSAKMYAPLEGDAERQLPPLLDVRCRWGELVARAVALGRVARRCIDMMASQRCTVADVLPELDAIAGRMAVVRAGRGEEYDPATGKLRQKASFV